MPLESLYNILVYKVGLGITYIPFFNFTSNRLLYKLKKKRRLALLFS